MNIRYLQAAAVALFGMTTIVWSILAPGDGSTAALIVGSATAPLAVLLAVSGRVGSEPRWTALIGGGTIGVLIALASHAVVFGFAYAFFLGFKDEAVALLDLLRIDPRITSLVGSPWTIVLLIELVIVAPLTEEVGKAVGSRLVEAEDRKSAFLTGVAAGAGFAAVENVFYAIGGAFFGEAWQAIVIGRMVGAAVHPLASGLVVMGWWEWRQSRDGGLATRRFFAGAGVHALWNGSLAVIAVASTAFDVGGTSQAYAITSLTYAAALGIILAAVLWRIAVSLEHRDERLVSVDFADGRVVGAWMLLAASFLLPVAMLLLAFPGFST